MTRRPDPPAAPGASIESAPGAAARVSTGPGEALPADGAATPETDVGEAAADDEGRAGADDKSVAGADVGGAGADDKGVARADPTRADPTRADPTRADPGQAGQGTDGAETGEVVPLLRRRSGRAIAGVASGVADHLGVEVLWVRVVFTVLAGLGGAGVLAYGLLWIFMRQSSPERELPEPSQRERMQAYGLAAVGAGLAAASGAIGGETNVGAWITGPLGFALVGAVVVWHEADKSQRRKIRDGASSVLGDGPLGLLRIVAGIVLVGGGLAVFLLGNVDLGQLQFGLLAAVAALVGVGVLTVPWWLKMVRDLGDERRARIRTEERAEIAAHLHDSVLQTLALIQKQADAPREVRRLARRQERELRTWLYDEHGMARDGRDADELDGAGTGRSRKDGKDRPAPRMLGAVLAAAAAEVEDTYAISVQPVVVGDCAVDPAVAALAQAAREAMVNAAKHSGVGEVSLYVEVEPDVVHVFVRDRGAGFDPDAVPSDRHGLADSIHGRMERNGGLVRVRTAPGEGTEVQLQMPLTTKVTADA